MTQNNLHARRLPVPTARPGLQSLALSNLHICLGQEGKLLDVLGWRREHNIGLEHLVVRSCRVGSDGDETKLREMV